MSSSKSSRNSRKLRISLFLTPLFEYLLIPNRNIVLLCWVNLLINGGFYFIFRTLATSESSSISILTIYTFNINCTITRQVLKLLSKISKNLLKEEHKVLLLMASKRSWIIVVASRAYEVIQIAALRIWVPSISSNSNSSKSTTPTYRWTTFEFIIFSVKISTLRSSWKTHRLKLDLLKDLIGMHS